MPLILTWAQHPSESQRRVLRGRNAGLVAITDISIIVPQAGRGGFYFPGPLAPGSAHSFWSPVPGTADWDTDQMQVVYYAAGVAIYEPSGWDGILR